MRPGLLLSASGSDGSSDITRPLTVAASQDRSVMDDPIVAASRRDLLDDIVAADAVAAADRKRREKRVFAIAVALVVVLAGAVILFGLVAYSSIENQREQRVASARRVDILNHRIEELGSELSTAAYSNGQQLGVLSQQVAALQEQVRQLGGEPVVTGPSSQPPPSGTTPPTTQPPTTTSTTQPPPPEPEPDPCDGVSLLGICIEPTRRTA